jgi:hypothetical protein
MAIIGKGWLSGLENGVKAEGKGGEEEFGPNKSMH